MKRWLIVTSVLAVAGLATPALAQQSATLVLRSGERVGGELVDMGAGGLTFRVGGQDRQFPVSQVAVVDFAGGGTNFPSGELDQVGDGGVVTTGGANVKGTLYDVGGKYPLRITIDLPGGGTRDYNSTDLKRIYIARPSGASSSAAGQTGSTAPGPTPMPGGGNALRLPANQRWVDTGINVRRGDMVRFKASGLIQLSSDPNDTASPSGSKTGRRPASPMPQTLAGALIGRIGPVNMFGIGEQTQELGMPGDGRLYVGINDDDVNDNQGEFQVEVTPSARAQRR